jgi:hypothetical protein
MKSLRLAVVAVLLAVAFVPAVFAADNQPTGQAQPVMDLFQSMGQCNTSTPATGDQTVLPLLMPAPQPDSCQCTAAKHCPLPGCFCSNSTCGICNC